jgi:hypothetical protein
MAFDNHPHGSEYIKAVVDSGQSTIKTLLVLNGGAAISFLTFLGQAFKDESIPSQLVGPFGLALRFFMAGAFLAATCAGSTYLSNLVQSLGWARSGRVFLCIAILVGFISLISFATGGWIASGTFIAFVS